MFDTHVNLMPLVLLAVTGFVVPFGTYLGHAAIGAAERLLAPKLGQETALLFQQRADALLDKAIGAAANKYLPELQLHGLTVDVGNQMIAWAADYAVNHDRGLSDQLNTWEGELQEKIGARILAHTGVHAAVGPVAVPTAAPVAHAA